LGKEFEAFLRSDAVCSENREQWLKYFDDWVVYASLETRKFREAETDNINPFTTFFDNWYQEKVENPDPRSAVSIMQDTSHGHRYRTFAHEFRHLMLDNRKILRRSTAEDDANSFEQDFWSAVNGKGCLCRK
jgi:hypothetical protein